MKVVHRKTLWFHTFFSALMCVGLTALVLVKKDLSITILVVLLAAYILGNVAIHIRRDDFRREVLFEYSLIGIAIFVVLGSTLQQ